MDVKSSIEKIIQVHVFTHDYKANNAKSTNYALLGGQIERHENTGPSEK